MNAISIVSIEIACNANSGSLAVLHRFRTGQAGAVRHRQCVVEESRPVAMGQSVSTAVQMGQNGCHNLDYPLSTHTAAYCGPRENLVVANRNIWQVWVSTG